MSKVGRKHGQRKLEVLRTEAVAQALADLDTRVEVIQALIPLGLRAVEDELKAAVAAAREAGKARASEQLAALALEKRSPLKLCCSLELSGCIMGSEAS